MNRESSPAMRRIAKLIRRFPIPDACGDKTFTAHDVSACVDGFVDGNAGREVRKSKTHAR